MHRCNLQKPVLLKWYGGETLVETTQDPCRNVLVLLADLKTCSKAGNLKRGRHVHAEAVQYGHGSNIYFLNALINMYAKCGSMLDAHHVFERMKYPNVVSWTALILGYAENGQGETGLKLFAKMISEGPAPDSVTIVAALKACLCVAIKEGRPARLKCMNQGKEIERLAKEKGFYSDVKVQNTLIDMYGKCGMMVDAHKVFDSMNHPSVVSWTALILGYAENEQGLVAVDLFARMRTGGVVPNYVTIVAVLKGCISLALKDGPSGWTDCRDRGRKIHDFAIEVGCDSNSYVQSSLIDMYAKCGCMSYAHDVFDNVRHPDVVSWTALIIGYVDNGDCLQALDLFVKMRAGGPPPNQVTVVAVLKACTSLGALEFGRKVHLEMNCMVDVVLVNCLVDFYAKCGSLIEAQNVFNSLGARNVVTWNALLGGFSSCGDSASAFGVFKLMHDTGFLPDAITFLAMLACCNHTGLVEKGKEYFEAMSRYGISPTIEHYNCMVDVLGRANKLDDAVALLRGMPCNANDVTWRTLLSACSIWKCVEIGRLAFLSLIHLNGMDAGAYVIMGLLYKSRGMLQEREIVMGMCKMLPRPKAGETCWTNEVKTHYFVHSM